MKILYIITKATYGGAQTHIKQCANYMREKGNTVAVMAHSNSGKGLEGEIRELGVNFYPNDFLKNSFNLVNGIFALIAIRKVLKEFKPDIVSCHSSYAGFFGRLAVMNRAPVVFTAHGWGFTQGAFSLHAKIIKITERIVTPLCKRIICVSDNDKDIALKYHVASIEKLTTIHNGVELDEPDYKSDTVYEFNNKIPIVFVGRLTKGKSPEQLIKAFSLLPKNLQEISHIYMIGGGEKREMLEGMIAQNNLSESVSLVGELSRKEVLYFLSECIKSSQGNIGIFSLISLYEGFPRSILEGMKFGFSIIASDVGGVRESVTKDVGILTERNNIDSVKSALESLLCDKDKMKQFGENAKQKVTREFSLQEMLSKTEEVYKSIL